MANDFNLVQSLVSNPSESLNVELKGWIDPKTCEGVAKIAKALLALRNNDGGYLIIGIDDKTHSVDLKNSIPKNIQRTFHTDEMQAIVTKYASEPFPVTVDFINSATHTHPVVRVPSGSKTIVASKSGLQSDSGAALIKPNQVYVRTLRSNGTVSTSEAHYQDWDRLIEICMDNREADAARFMRRYFGDRNVGSVLKMLGEKENTDLEDLLKDGQKRFLEVVDTVEKGIDKLGYWEVAVIPQGEIPQHRCNQIFLNLLDSSNPRLTGWPIWMNGQSIPKSFGNKSPVNNFWESAIVTEPVAGWLSVRHADFWRISPIGHFYALRYYEDDLLPSDRQIRPGIVLDFSLIIWRTAEALAVSLAFAKAMQAVPDKTSLKFAFRWNHLKGRILASWADPGRSVYGAAAEQASITSFITVPMNTAFSALGPYVFQLTRPLFELFGGSDIKAPVIEEIVKKAISRG
jgi:hypothetical protein